MGQLDPLVIMSSFGKKSKKISRRPNLINKCMKQNLLCHLVHNVDCLLLINALFKFEASSSIKGAFALTLLSWSSDGCSTCALLMHMYSYLWLDMLMSCLMCALTLLCYFYSLCTSPFYLFVYHICTVVHTSSVVFISYVCIEECGEVWALSTLR